MNGNILISTFQRLRQRLRSKALVITGNEQDADDALQNAFCSLWQKAGGIDSISVAEGMSHVVVRNESIDILRGHKRHPHQAIEGTGDRQAAASDTSDVGEVFSEVRAIIERELPERDRQLLYKREMYGYEISELAEEYGLTEANVRMILSRARRHIRDCYREYKK